MRFAFIEAEKAKFSVCRMCRHLEVSRAGYYAWRGRPQAPRAGEDAKLELEIAAVHAESRGRYGSPRVHAELRARGRRIGRHRVARLMRKGGLAARRRRRFRTTTDSDHSLPVAPNVLARKFRVSAPNRAWVTDLTYIWTREGWLYLAAILDLFSRRVVGWATSDRITRELALRALENALLERGRSGVHHSCRAT